MFLYFAGRATPRRNVKEMCCMTISSMLEDLTSELDALIDVDSALKWTPLFIDATCVINGNTAA